MSNIYQAKGSTLVEQYEDVGKLFAAQLRKRIRQSKVKKNIAIKVLARMYSIPRLHLFTECFDAWARGAGITKLKAMYLLVDNLVGCQTMMVRYKCGIGMMHTEEDFDDPIARMKGAHTIEFNDNGRKLLTLTYNNLMPGAALYGWQKDMLIAVDALFLREDDASTIAEPMLANIIGWLIWQMKPDETEPERTVTELAKLGTLVDGYAVNVVRNVNHKIEGYKVLFSRNDWMIEKLGEKVGDKLYQVNIFDQRLDAKDYPITQWQAPRVEIEDYDSFIERQNFLEKIVDKYTKYLNTSITNSMIKSIHTRIQGMIFGEYNSEFVNEWMGAAVVGIMDQELGVSVSCKLNDQQPLTHLEYISHID